MSCLFVFLVSGFYSCAAVNDRPLSQPYQMINNLPFYPQETYQCGPASLAAVMNYRNIPVKPDEVAEEIYSKSAHGTLNLDLIIYAQQKGLSAYQYKGNMDDLKKNIDRSNPLIVLVDYGLSFYKANHFMVVVGYTEYGVIVHSGKKKDQFLTYDNFIKAWGKTDYWTLLLKSREL